MLINEEIGWKRERLTYQIEMESSEIVGSGRSPDISTSPWLYHISKLHSLNQRLINPTDQKDRNQVLKRQLNRLRPCLMKQRLLIRIPSPLLCGRIKKKKKKKDRNRRLFYFCFENSIHNTLKLMASPKLSIISMFPLNY